MAKAVSFQIVDGDTRTLAGQGCHIKGTIAVLDAQLSGIVTELRNRAVDGGLGGPRGTKAVIETDLGPVYVVHVNHKQKCNLSAETVRRLYPEVFAKVFVEKTTYTFDSEAYEELLQSDPELAKKVEGHVTYEDMAARVTFG